MAKKPNKIFLSSGPLFGNSFKHYSVGGVPGKGGILKPALYIFGITVLGAGSTVLYLKYDPSAKQWVETNIPGSKSLFKLISLDGKSYTDTLNNIKQQTFGSVNNLIGFGETKVELDKLPLLSNETKKNEVSKKPLPVNLIEKAEAKESKGSTNNSSKDTPKVNTPSSDAGKEATTKVSKRSKPKATEEHIDKIFKKVEDLEKRTLVAIDNVTNVLKDYREQVISLTEQAVEKDDDNALRKIKEKYEEKEKHIKKAEKVAKNMTKELDKLRKLLYDESIDINEEKRTRLKMLLEHSVHRVTDALSVINDKKSNAFLAEKYWENVVDARKKLADSLGLAFPSLVVEDVSDLTDEELSLFAIYTCRLIKLYQAKLEKSETLLTSQLNTIYDSFKDGKSDKVKEIVNLELEKEKRKLGEKYIKDELAIKLEHENDLRQQLKRQMEVHNDYLTELIELKDQEMERELKHIQDDREEELRLNYNKQLAQVIGKLKGLEEVLQEKIDADKKAERSQILWNSCQSLVLALKSGTSTKPWNEQIKPLEDEITSVLKAAAEGDELVNTVVASIPKEARSRGVYSEFALRERFLNVEKIAYRVAKHTEGPVSLFSLALSYLQSCLLIDFSKPIPPDELSNEPFDASTLNNYDVLRRARYWIDRGDFEQTLRYMNLLKGASRAISNEWMNETRIFLETQQAVNALLSYAVYSSLMYLKISS